MFHILVIQFENQNTITRLTIFISQILIVDITNWYFIVFWQISIMYIIVISCVQQYIDFSCLFFPVKIKNKQQCSQCILLFGNRLVTDIRVCKKWYASVHEVNYPVLNKPSTTFKKTNWHIKKIFFGINTLVNLNAFNTCRMTSCPYIITTGVRSTDEKQKSIN